MTLSLDEIKLLKTVDLEDFEIRGVKYGIENAATTGPVFVQGTYEPYRNTLTGNVSFDSTDSSVARSLSFDAPFGSYDALVLKSDDKFTVGSTDFTISSVVDSTSVVLSDSPGISGAANFTSVLAARDYLIEPDTGNNFSSGNATFTSGSEFVNGSGTTWVSELDTGDTIRPENYQMYLPIKQVHNNTLLELESPFSGATVSGPYIAKRQLLGRAYLQYTKDEFTYEKNKARWEVTDTTTGSEILTAKNIFFPIADGIETKFTESIDQEEPDISQTGTVLAHLLAKSTEIDYFQFSLPAVPKPESSFELFINDEKKDRYPDGNRDYVINYFQDPVYQSPPPVEERQIASLMFLGHATDVPLDPALTASGLISFVDEDGNQVAGIMPGSEDIRIDGTSQQSQIDYVVDTATGTVSITDSVTNENIVNYISTNESDLIDYGITVKLDGKKLQYSIPPQNTDEVKIVLRTGRFKPADKDTPAPGEEYVVDYYTDAPAEKEIVEVIPGMTYYRTQKYPIKNETTIVFKNGDILEEGIDYRVSYNTGRVVLFNALVDGDSLEVNYTPLSKQVNGIIFEDDTVKCVSYDSRMFIVSASNYSLRLTNPSLDPENIEILRIYNETRNKEYDLTGYEVAGSSINLQQNSTNTSIGMSSTDAVVIDYKFENEGLEYPPTPINYKIPIDTDSLYIIGRDVTSKFPAGSLVRLIPGNFAEKVFVMLVDSVSFDGEDTSVKFTSTFGEEILNPSLFVTDDSPSFVSVSGTSDSIVSGSTSIFFDSSNFPNLFRGNAVLRIDTDYYSIRASEYLQEGDTTGTRITLSTEAVQNYTDSSVLSNIAYTDSPLYAVGDTVVSTANGLITDPAQPAMKIEFLGEGSASIETDSTALFVDTTDGQTVFDYATYPTVSSLSTALSSLGYLSTTNYVSDWTTSKIVPVETSIGSDSPVTLTIDPALRLNGVDTTNFTIVDENIVLDQPLQAGQRYHLDYQGRKYLGNSQVVYTADFFETLPQGSKVVASFEYDVLDQFYIQVMSQREFLETVIQPNAKEEAQQQQGNVGQGGTIPSDEDQGNAEGGTTDDEYRRKDTEIECRIFDKIFDYFNSRATLYNSEYECALGKSICNNDGLLSEDDQDMATKSFNRMWPVMDHTSLEPLYVAPLTGTTYGPRQPLPHFQSHGVATASFINGSTGVVGSGTFWKDQVTSGVSNWIRPADSTTEYLIDSVVSDSSISLAQPYDGPNVSGGGFALTSSVPFFDDDGHMGAKIEGTKSGDFNLSNADVFNCELDGTSVSYTFDGTSVPLSLFFPLDSLSASDVARQISNGISGLTMTEEWVWDQDTAFGYRNALVIRTDSTFNCIKLGSGTAVGKLGFTPNTTVCGNRSSDQSSELPFDQREAAILSNEYNILGDLISHGSSNKLDRTDSVGISYVNGIIDYISEEADIMVQTQKKLNCQIAALNGLLEETGGEAPSTNPDSSAALVVAIAFQADTSVAQDYADSILTNWEGKGDGTAWVLDYDSSRQYIRGVNTSGVGVKESGGAGIDPITTQLSFILDADLDATGFIDRRILNILPSDIPVIRYEDNNNPVPGTFSGFDLNPPVSGLYSNDSTLQFTASPFDAFTIFRDTTDPGPYSYQVDGTSMTIFYTLDSTSYVTEFPYSFYTTIGNLKSGIASIQGLDTGGSPSHDSSKPTLLIDSGSISPDATIVATPLRDLYIDYQTISDTILSDRSSFVNGRSSTVSSRVSFLNTREGQIKSSMEIEGLFFSDGAFGDLYLWANNRFNRRQGCDARLQQIEAQIEASKSALGVTGTLI